eukprot:g1702.t1
MKYRASQCFVVAFITLGVLLFVIQVPLESALLSSEDVTLSRSNVNQRIVTHRNDPDSSSRSSSSRNTETLRGSSAAAESSTADVICSANDPLYTNGIDYVLKVTGKSDRCSLPEKYDAFLPVDAQRHASECLAVDSCVDVDLLRRTRASHRDIFGAEDRCNEGKRFVIRNFISPDECAAFQDMHRRILRDHPSSVGNAGNPTKGYGKVPITVNDSLSWMCNADEMELYLNVTKRMKNTLHSYFLPRNHDRNVLDTDAINQLTHLDARLPRNKGFLYPANVHADNCVPMRYFDKGESESSDALGPGEIQCDFSTHPFPHRKFTTILYLSDTIGLTDEQLDMANFRDSLHVQDISHRRLEEDAEEEDERRHVSGSIVEEENGHRNLGSTPQSYKYRKALDTLTATQRDFVEGNEYASVGGGLCFPKWTEDRGADVDVLDPEQALVSSIAECRRSPPQSKTGCCDKLLQTRCGDLVAFSSGGENPHAVMPVLTGKRLNIQTWWAPRKSPPFANCGMQKIAIAEEISETCKTKNQDVFDSAFVLGMGEPVRIYEVSCKTYSNGNRRCRHASAPFDDTRRVAKKIMSKTPTVPYLEDFPVLAGILDDNMTVKRLKSATTKADLSLTPRKKKSDYILAVLLTIARKHGKDGKGYWDTTRLLGSTSKLSVACKRAIEDDDEALREWADFIFTFQSKEMKEESDVFEICEECCPVLFDIVMDAMKLDQLKSRSNKMDTKTGSTTKKDYTAALLATAGRRAAEHVMKSKSRRKNFSQTFDELLALLTARGKTNLKALKVNKRLQATLEWCQIVSLKFEELLGGKRLDFGGDVEDSPAMNTRSKTRARAADRGRGLFKRAIA